MFEARGCSDGLLEIVCQSKVRYCSYVFALSHD
jgi:hypothetical protein